MARFSVWGLLLPLLLVGVSLPSFSRADDAALDGLIPGELLSEEELEKVHGRGVRLATPADPARAAEPARPARPAANARPASPAQPTREARPAAPASLPLSPRAALSAEPARTAAPAVLPALPVRAAST
ncbi:MAG: hypothetical protein O7B23_10705, partial [Deltaproteobacteria bacterium]|nr:hypothetical protein [Deltaproteobacteria bacterium]